MSPKTFQLHLSLIYCIEFSVPLSTNKIFLSIEVILHNPSLLNISMRWIFISVQCSDTVDELLVRVQFQVKSLSQLLNIPIICWFSSSLYLILNLSRPKTVLGRQLITFSVGWECLLVADPLLIVTYQGVKCQTFLKEGVGM